MMSKTTFAALAVALTSSACVISPYSGETVDRHNPIRFEMYATSPGATIRLECRHHYGSVQWSTTITGGSSAITYNGDTLYPKTVNLTVPSACWEPWSGYGYITYIRPHQGSYAMAVFDQAGQDCVFDRVFGDGEGPIAAGNTCRKSGKDILLISPN